MRRSCANTAGKMTVAPGPARRTLRAVTSNRHLQFLIIFLTILLSTIGFGVCIPVLPLYAEKFGASEFVNGLLTGVFSLMVMVASPLWGMLSDRIGRRPVLIISILGSAVGYFIMGWAGSLGWLFVARIIDGASGGNVATAQAYIADITKPDERSKAMGMIGAAFGLGFIIGPVIGGIMAQWTVHTTIAGISINIPEGHMPFYFVGVLCIINAVMVYTSLPESLTEGRRAQAHTVQPVSELLNHSDGPVYITVATSYFVCLAAFSIMTAVFSLFGQDRFGLDERHIGYIMAVIGVIGVIMQGGVLRRILPIFGEVKLARTGFVLLLISFILLPLTSGMYSLVAVSCLIALGNSLTQPTLNGLASRSVEAAWQGRAMGLLQSAASLGRGIGPILGGWLLGMDRGNPANYGRTPFWVAAFLMVVTLILGAGLRAPTRGASAVQRGEADTEPAAEI